MMKMADLSPETEAKMKAAVAKGPPLTEQEVEGVAATVAAIHEDHRRWRVDQRLGHTP